VEVWAAQHRPLTRSTQRVLLRPSQRHVAGVVQNPSAVRAGHDFLLTLAGNQNLRREFAELQTGREALAAAVDETARARYERLSRSKGENVVVGVHHGVCGGCHMKLPAQILVTCQSQKEIVACSNCGRILYYTRDMALAGAD